MKPYRTKLHSREENRFGFIKHIGRTFVHGVESIGHDIENAGDGLADDVNTGLNAVKNGADDVINALRNAAQRAECALHSINALADRIDTKTVGLPPPQPNSNYET